MTEKPGTPAARPQAGKRGQVDLAAWPEVKHMTGQLVKAREEAKLSQAQAAKILGTAQSYLAELEKGRVNPTFQLLAALARAYKVPMARFSPDKVVRRPADTQRGVRRPDATAAENGSETVGS